MKIVGNVVGKTHWGKKDKFVKRCEDQVRILGKSDCISLHAKISWMEFYGYVVRCAGRGGVGWAKDILVGGMKK